MRPVASTSAADPRLVNTRPHPIPMDPALIAEFETRNANVAAVLRELSGQTPYYFACPGNGGDCIIASATYQLFKHYGINFKLLRPRQVISDSTILLAGGGNLVPHYDAMASVIRALLGKNNRLIVLPHSVRGLDDLLGQLDPSTTLFCREAASLEHVRRSAPQCSSFAADDLGIFLDVSAVEASVDRNEAMTRFTATLAEANTTPEKIKGRQIFCMRRGVEKTVVPKGPNIDISTYFRTGTDPKGADIGAWMMLEFCRLPSTITTNRLHVGIAAALVGTPVIFLDNSYGKVSGVFNKSIAGRFPTATLSDPSRSASLWRTD